MLTLIRWTSERAAPGTVRSRPRSTDREAYLGPVPLAEAQAELFVRIVESVLESLALTPEQDKCARQLLRAGLLRAGSEDDAGSAWWP